MKAMVMELYTTCIEHTTMSKDLPVLPHDPLPLFTSEELNKMEHTRRRIFCAYFTDEATELNAVIDFNPHTDFDYLLFGIYHRKNHVDYQMAKLLVSRPELFVLTKDTYFTALYAPHLPLKEYERLDICAEDEEINLSSVIYLDEEPHSIDTAGDLLHGSPLLRDVTFFMGEHANDLFRKEIDVLSSFLELLPDITSCELLSLT